jgi:hypothetical protein
MFKGLTPKERKPWLGLIRRRECLVLTWRGRLVVVLALALLAFVALKGVHPFLAINDPLPGGVLVVEGWASDHALAAATQEFKNRPYSKLYVTGGPIERGAPLSEYKTYAELGAATLLKLGMDTNSLQAVPAPLVRKDRTYISAVTLKNWLQDHSLTATNFNVLTGGPHARRTRLLFKAALGEGANVGIVAVQSPDYDPVHWWRSSQGVRVVLDEFIAYTYARFLFSPAGE